VNYVNCTATPASGFDQECLFGQYPACQGGGCQPVINIPGYCQPVTPHP
jgi:hypothetical protein